MYERPKMKNHLVGLLSAILSDANFGGVKHHFERMPRPVACAEFAGGVNQMRHEMGGGLFDQYLLFQIIFQRRID